jgi:Uma2 family endonuclease
MSTAAVLNPVLASVPSIRDDDALYEIINGQRVELPPMSAYAGIVASRLHGKLTEFASANPVGEPVIEVLFRLPLNGDRNRRPDVAFVSYKRWPKGRPVPIDDNAWDVVPDLAIEVVSPNDLAEDLLEKVQEYFRAGVEMVWVVYPRLRLIQVYESLSRIRGLTRTDELDGGPVLPGFRLPLATLFPEEPAAT